MLFTKIDFLLFLLIVLFLLVIAKRRSFQKAIILAASYFFYAYWDYRFVVLLIIPTIVDFHIAKKLDKPLGTSNRKLLLSISIIVNLMILIYFKYTNWLISSFESFPFFSTGNMKTLNIILPLGISFYTFRVLTYTIDVYRRKIISTQNILDFALYVSFFPVLIAGPITRASHFLPQLKSLSLSLENIYSGFRVFVMGLFLKLFIADRIAMFVDHFYANFSVFDTSTTWLAVLAYSLQIYCDFAGYSSMAIGVALIVGIKIEENFDFPYLSSSIKEFWRRWHITLSTWIRDYVYIPLGGNRKGEFRTYLNLLFAMTLCGLWHGAAWTFVFWGLLHGIAIAIAQIWSKLDIAKYTSNTKIYSFFSWFLTFMFLTISWVFFRAENFNQAFMIIKQLVIFKNGIVWHQPFAIFILVAASLVHLFKMLKVRIVDLPVNAPYTLTILFCLIWLVIVFNPQKFQPFIYAQF